MARSARSVHRPARVADTAGLTSAPRIGRPRNDRFRALFARNLGQLLDRRADVPSEPAARAAELARICGVTPAAARKWLTGAGWPTLEKLFELAHRYDFAPDDLLAEGPRQVVDVTRLVDAQALRRAALAELSPVPAFGETPQPLALAMDPALLWEGDDDTRALPATAGSVPLALMTLSDDSMAPLCRAGDRIVFALDASWAGDGLYLLQALPGGPLALRRVTRVAEGFSIAAAPGPDALPPQIAPGLAGDEAEALDGRPILRGRALGLLRALPSAGG